MREPVGQSLYVDNFAVYRKDDEERVIGRLTLFSDGYAFVADANVELNPEMLMAITALCLRKTRERRR